MRIKKIIFSVFGLLLVSCVSPATRIAAPLESEGASLQLYGSSSFSVLIGRVFVSHTYITGEVVCDVSAGRDLLQNLSESNWGLQISYSGCGKSHPEEFFHARKLAASLAENFFKTKEILNNLISERLVNYDLKLILVPPHSSVDEVEYDFGYSGITHEYYLNLPESREEEAQWLANNIARVFHEYFHDLVDISSIEYSNSASEEAAAYILGMYIMTKYQEGNDGLIHLSINGKPVDPALPPKVVDRDAASVEASFQGKRWAIQSLAYVLGSNVLETDNPVHGRKLDVLCSLLLIKRLNIAEPQYLSSLEALHNQ